MSMRLIEIETLEGKEFYQLLADAGFPQETAEKPAAENAGTPGDAQGADGA